eukprot:1159954-Pelagomonas_calceolata.AAC.4
MQDASQGSDPSLDLASRGLSVIHRRKNFQLLQQDERPSKAGGASARACPGEAFPAQEEAAILPCVGFSHLLAQRLLPTAASCLRGYKGSVKSGRSSPEQIAAASCLHGYKGSVQSGRSSPKQTAATSCLRGNVSAWLAGQDFGRVFSQANMAQHSFSSKYWKSAPSATRVASWARDKSPYHAAVGIWRVFLLTHLPGQARALHTPYTAACKPKHYARHTQLRVAKGSYWDRFMGFMNWLNNLLPVFDPHTPGRRAMHLKRQTWRKSKSGETHERPSSMITHSFTAIFCALIFLGLVRVQHLPYSNLWTCSGGSMPPEQRSVLARGLLVVFFLGRRVISAQCPIAACPFSTAFAAHHLLRLHLLLRYVDKTGHLVKDTDRIALEYMKFWFWIDL